MVEHIASVPLDQMSFKGLSAAPLQETPDHSFRDTAGLFSSNSSTQCPGFKLAVRSRPRRLHMGSEWIAFPQQHRGPKAYIYKQMQQWVWHNRSRGS